MEFLPWKFLIRPQLLFLHCGLLASFNHSAWAEQQQHLLVMTKESDTSKRASRVGVTCSSSPQPCMAISRREIMHFQSLKPIHMEHLQVRQPTLALYCVKTHFNNSNNQTSVETTGLVLSSPPKHRDMPPPPQPSSCCRGLALGAHLQLAPCYETQIFLQEASPSQTSPMTHLTRTWPRLTISTSICYFYKI